MSNFHRDTDAAAFTALNDPTASARSSASVSPTKRATGGEDRDNEALASLRRRMAGPSSSKAGLATDQDEINRKIYEASKGSKYFENEKRSDERTTEQIEAMLRRRDTIMSQVPEGSPAWVAAQRRADDQVMALEAQRDLSRIILHADMDMFYAAVELKRDPSLKGKAFGVGSGVLVTASYEARRFGCRSGMATHVALALCPHLIVVKNDMSSYVAASQEVMTVFEQYDPNYAQMSLDEAYMDITPFCEMNGMSADEVVKEVRESVLEKTGLTVSVGIAPNKMLAKISSDKNKPNGQFRVEPDRNFIVDLMHHLPCRKIPGIGRVTERILSSLGVNTCGDIYPARTMLHLTLGNTEWLLSAYLGIHSNVVEPAKRGERKSVGREHTFRPTSDPIALKDYLRQSADQVEKDLTRLDYRGKTVTLTCKTDAFRRFTRARTMDSYQYKADSLFAITSKLLDAEIAARGGPFAMRLIGVRVSGLRDLREPEHGGIKRMFEQVRTSPRKRKNDGERTDATDEEEFEIAMQRALKQSDEFQRGSQDRRECAHDGSLQSSFDATCPVCYRVVPLHDGATVDVQSANLRLNEHIDRCLEGKGDEDLDAAAATSSSKAAPAAKKAPPISKKKAKKATNNTLDAFFERR